MADVTLFENAGFAGRSTTLGPGQHALTDFDDIASSIRVPAGMVALVFESAGASGGSGLTADFLEDCADLTAYYLDNKISYVSVFPATQASGLVWVRAQIVNGAYVAGHWERRRATGGPTNPTVPTLSPVVLPHLLEISRANGTPWVNPPFDTSNPNWSSNVVGGKTFDGSSSHPFEWVSVLNPSVEQDDEVGMAGTVIVPDLSGDDLPFTHPFGNDFEFTIVPDAAYLPLLAPANRDSRGVYSESWPPARQLFGADPAGVLALEVDAALVPEADRVKHADRIAVYGRWIVDAGHSEFHTEIHPPLLMAGARCVDATGKPVPPALDAITHVQFWSRPYQPAQRFTTNGDTGLCLQDYIKRIVETVRGISAYPPIFAKPFAGVHLVAFTVRPATKPAPVGRLGTVIAAQRQLECSYHFTVNGSCGVEVIPSPADPNAVLVLFALSDAGYPKLPEPSSHMKQFSIGELLNEAKSRGTDITWYEDAFFWLKQIQLSDQIGFRIYNAPATSAQDSAGVVPFTPLHTLPASAQVTDPQSPFPVRGWLKLAWVPSRTTTVGSAAVLESTVPHQ